MLADPLLYHARNAPDHIAVTDDNGQYTWAQLAAMAGGLSIYLAMQTSRPHVGILLPTGMGYVVSFYGTLLAGKCVVPINFLLGDREIAHVVANSGIDTVITIPQLAGRLVSSGLKIIDLTQLAGKLPPGFTPPPPPKTNADDMAVLMYTSGTSALPKGVVLTYGNLWSDVQACIKAAALQQQHRFLGVIPLFHAFGMTAMMLAPVTLGAPVFYQARFSAAGMVEQLRKHRASIIFGVPSMFAAVARLKSASAEDFQSIYAMISGGEPLPATLRQIFAQRFNVPLYEGYGLTETSPVVALNTPQAHRAGSVGKPVPGVKVKIADDGGQPLPPQHDGEIWLAGPMVTRGYYQMPVETEAARSNDGFFKTGDLGRMDEDGFLYITGRKKDLIIVSGEKVVPREVEEVMLSHSAVAEAAVVGHRDESRGEVVVAFVVLQPDHQVRPDELRSFCRDRGLVPFKVPRHVVVADSLPRSPTGKVLKRVLAETPLNTPPGSA